MNDDELKEARAQSGPDSVAHFEAAVELRKAVKDKEGATSVDEIEAALKMFGNLPGRPYYTNIKRHPPYSQWSVPQGPADKCLWPGTTGTPAEIKIWGQAQGPEGCFYDTPRGALSQITLVALRDKNPVISNFIGEEFYKSVAEEDGGKWQDLTPSEQKVHIQAALYLLRIADSTNP